MGASDADRLHARSRAAARLPLPNLAWIFLIAVLARVAACLVLNALGVTTPQNEHWAHAHSLVDGNGFGFDWYGLFPGPVVGSFVPPLYPAVLAGFLELAGGADRTAMILAQILNALLGGATAWLIGMLTASLVAAEPGAAPRTGSRAPQLAALAWALYPPAIGQAAVTNTAVLEGWLLLALATILASAARSGPAPIRRWAVAGLLLGAGLHVRPTFGVIWAAWAAVLLARPATSRRGLAAGILIASAVAGISAMPWTARNYRVHGALVPIATNGGFNFAIGNDPRYGGGIPPLERIFRRMPEQEQARLRGMSEIERDRAFYAEGIEHWRNQPGALLKGVGRKLAAFVFFRPYLFRGYPPWVAAIFVVSYTALLVAFGAGLRRARGAIRDLSLVAIVLTGLLALVYVVSMRYRASVEPLMALIGSAAILRRR